MKDNRSSSTSHWLALAECRRISAAKLLKITAIRQACHKISPWFTPIAVRLRSELAVPFHLLYFASSGASNLFSRRSDPPSPKLEIASTCVRRSVSTQSHPLTNVPGVWCYLHVIRAGNEHKPAKVRLEFVSRGYKVSQRLWPDVDLLDLFALCPRVCDSFSRPFRLTAPRLCWCSPTLSFFVLTHCIKKSHQVYVKVRYAIISLLDYWGKKNNSLL